MYLEPIMITINVHVAIYDAVIVARHCFYVHKWQKRKRAKTRMLIYWELERAAATFINVKYPSHVEKVVDYTSRLTLNFDL